ncbi:MAG: class I SAM-dependent methyltransferase [Solirubrobacterales bacterium]
MADNQIVEGGCTEPVAGSPGAWDEIFARAYDAGLWLGERAGMAERRSSVLSAARGRTLELGAGTGLNLEHYPPDLDTLVLTDPEKAMDNQLRQRARKAERAAEVVPADAQDLPFEDGSFDTVVVTLVLCTVDDPQAAVREIQRVLAPGGRLLFIEHVVSETPWAARLQRLVRRPWRAFAAGCRCDRDTASLLRGSFANVDLQRGPWRAVPPVTRPLIWGSAGG